jgi:hypothetical protein
MVGIKKEMLRKDITKSISCLIFIIIFFSFLSCYTNLYKENNVDNKNEQTRFFEDVGGFSIIPPSEWQVTKFPGLEYKGFIGQRNNDVTPNIAFTIEIFDGPLNNFVDLVIEYANNELDVDFKLLQRNSFVTIKQLKGEKIITNITLQGRNLRQYYYFFSGNNNKLFQAICTVSAESSNTYDEMFDKSIKTFEWKEYIPGKYFIEESGKFLLIPNGSWQEIKFPGSKYKTIIIGNKAAYISFDILELNGELNLLVDLLLKQFENDEGFELIQRDNFVTSKNVKGQKILFKLNDNKGHYFRQIIYYLPRNTDEIITVLCVVYGNTDYFYDAIFDKIMETFEWID